MTTYDCEICLTTNASHRFRCQCCGTTPRMFSWTGKPADIRVNEFSVKTTDVVIARGAERLESRRAKKVYFRTVKLDYYAS